MRKTHFTSPLKFFSNIPPGRRLQILSILIGLLSLLLTIYSMSPTTWIEFQISERRGKLPFHGRNTDDKDRESVGVENSDLVGYQETFKTGNTTKEKSEKRRMRWIATFKLLDFDNNSGSLPECNSTSVGASLFVQKVFAGLYEVCVVHEYDTKLCKSAAGAGAGTMEYETQRCLGCDEIRSFDDKKANEKLLSSTNSWLPPASHVATSISLSICRSISMARSTVLVASIVLIVGFILSLFGQHFQSFVLVAAAFTYTVAGLIQLLGLFFYAMMINDLTQFEIGTGSPAYSITYNYGSGFVCAVFVFLGTNMAAITATQSYKNFASKNEVENLIMESIQSNTSFSGTSSLYV